MFNKCFLFKFWGIFRERRGVYNTMISSFPTNHLPGLILNRLNYFSFSQDKYLLASMVMLSAVCTWHAIVTTLGNHADRTESIVLTILGVVYILYNIGFVIVIYLFVSISNLIQYTLNRHYIIKRIITITTVTPA